MLIKAKAGHVSNTFDHKYFPAIKLLFVNETVNKKVRHLKVDALYKKKNYLLFQTLES